MGNASAKLSDPEDRSRRSLGSRSTLVRRSKRVWTSLRPHRGARLVSKLILCGTSDDGVEERPQRRLRKACRDVPARRATGRRSRDRRPVAGQTDGEEHDWTPSDEKLGSQDRDSISFAKLDDHSAVTQESVEKDTKPRKECTICTESRLLSRFPKCPPTRSCTHSPDTCRRCLRKWITTSFTSKIWYHIDCPECNERLSYIDVKAFADPTLFFKYNELATKASLEEVPGFRWCLTRKCDSGQVHLEEKGPKFVCIRCNGEYCVVHQVRWHKKETCAEYEYRTRGKKKEAQEFKSRKWIEKKTKQCPGCGWNIEKDGGCDHMYCSRCVCEFCFECLGSVASEEEDDMGIVHRPGCSYAL